MLLLDNIDCERLQGSIAGTYSEVEKKKKGDVS